jgi:porphobilinogen synthase
VQTLVVAIADILEFLGEKEIMMRFPQYRPRRLRKDDLFRRMIRETHLRTDDLILPLFVRPGKGVKLPISSMPGHAQLSIDLLVKEVKEAKSLGIPGIILFGIPEKKDEIGSEGYADDGIVQRALRAIKEKVEGILVITDVCLCEYTSHGHCGVVKEGEVLNDDTLELLPGRPSPMSRQEQTWLRLPI